MPRAMEGLEVVDSAAHSNLTGVAVVALAALVCGLVLERLRQPAIVGYILAGVILGPSALAVVESRAQVDSLAELGVLLLLFVIGMEHKQDIKRLLQNRIGLILSLRHPEHHAEKVPRIRQLVVRMDVVPPHGVTIGIGRQGRHLAKQTDHLNPAGSGIVDHLGVGIEC